MTSAPARSGSLSARPYQRRDSDVNTVDVRSNIGSDLDDDSMFVLKAFSSHAGGSTTPGETILISWLISRKAVVQSGNWPCEAITEATPGPRHAEGDANFSNDYGI